MALTEALRVALEFMGPEGVREEIREARRVFDQVIVDFFPEILAAEIEEMEAVLEAMTGQSKMRCPQCQGTCYTQFNGETIVCPCVRTEA